MEALKTDVSKQSNTMMWPFPKGEDKSHMWRKLTQEAVRLTIVRSAAREDFARLSNKGA